MPQGTMATSLQKFSLDIYICEIQMRHEETSLAQKCHMVVAQAYREMINLPPLNVFKTWVENFMADFNKCWQQPGSKQDVRLAVSAHLQSHDSGMYFIMLSITQTACTQHSFDFLSYLGCSSGRTGGDALCACSGAALPILREQHRGVWKATFS